MFLVMPFVRGVSLSKLRRRLARDGALLAPELAAWIAAQVALGLHAAHELTVDGRPQGLVHRDVSPQNVLLGYDGRVVLLDFGIAKLFESANSTESGIIKGKFGYMSPEQCSASPVDRRSDVFSLGIVLHELLTGRDLFASLPPPAALLRIASTIAEPPSRSRPGLSARLDAIVARALAPARESRYATADELAHDLADYLASVGAPDGDRALRTLLADLFADERDALEQRLAQAMNESNLVHAAPEPTKPPTTFPGPSAREDTSKMEVPVEVVVAPATRPERRRRAGPLLAGILAVGVAGAVAMTWFDRAPASSSAAVDAPRADVATSPAPEPRPSATSPSEPSPSAREPATTTEPASPAAPATSAPRGPRAPATVAISAAPAPAPASALPAPSPSASFKGLPFRNL
jgi:serine/threonine protein kinase